MPSPFNLDAYLERIGYKGPQSATPGTLEAVHALHPAAIAFENLSPLLGSPVMLDADSLQAKLVAGRRGGWCFEQNTLFRHALEALGFSVTSLAARVVWNAPTGAPIGPRSHMLLLVDLKGLPWIADVGFGGNVLTAPLRLEPHSVQPTPNWYLCHHPSSFFRQKLMAARATPEGRYALLDNSLAFHRPNGTEKRTLTTPAALRSCLEHEFGLQLPDSPELEAMLERVAAVTPGGNGL